MTEALHENLSEDRMRRAEAVVTGNETIAPGCLILSLEVPEIASIIEPAQFVMLRGFESGFPYLPRPFSVFDLEGGDDPPSRDTLQILYEVIGDGTAAMARWTPGERVYCLGPLGRPYRLDARVKTPIFLAGGIGIAPFPYVMRRHPAPPSQQILLFGARTKAMLYSRDRFEDHGVDVRIATDDGSDGIKGTAVDLLEPLIEQLSIEDGGKEACEIYACGPTPMLKALQRSALRLDVRCQMSLEERMACGYGACVGCVQAIVDPDAEDGWRYSLICREGPVYDARQVLYTQPVPGQACSGAGAGQGWL